MRRSILLSLVFTMLCYITSCTNGKENSSPGDPTQVVKELNSRIDDEKKNMQETWAEVGTPGNIDAASVERECERLLEGNNMEMKAGMALKLSLTKVNIYNWYLEAINNTTADTTQGELTSEFMELDKVIESIAEYKASLAANNYAGGSMAALEYMAAKHDVYEAWYKTIRTATRPMVRMSSNEATDMVNTMHTTWANILKAQKENGNYDDIAPILEANDKLIKAAISDFKTLATKQPPHAWVKEVAKCDDLIDNN